MYNKLNSNSAHFGSIPAQIPSGIDPSPGCNMQWKQYLPVFECVWTDTNKYVQMWPSNTGYVKVSNTNTFKCVAKCLI